jgi:hypothetical protein
MPTNYAPRPFGGPVPYTITNPTYIITVGGEPRFVEAGSLHIAGSIGRRSEASFAVKTDAPTYFLEDTQVAIRDTSNNLVFTGYLAAPKYKKPGFEKILEHSLSAVDKHRLADKRRVAATFTNFTGAYIAQWLLDNILEAEGVTRGQIYDGSTCSDQLICSDTLYASEAVGTIPSAIFAYCKVSEALDAIVKAISSSGVPYYWQIDQYGKLWVVPYDAVVNSTIIDGSQIDEVGSPPTVTRTNPSYRNTQIVLSGTAETVQQTETRKGDSNNQSWTMSYALSRVPTVTVNSTSKTVGIRGVDSGKDFYWSKGEFEITQDSAGVKLTSTDTLQVVYIGQYPSVVIASNSAQIASDAAIDGSTGIVEEVESDSTLVSLDAELNTASALLTRYAVQSPIVLEFSTMQAGFAQGQLVTIDLPDYGINNTQMLIEDISASDSDGLNIWYRIKAVSGPSDQSWVEFFGNLVKTNQQANSINLGTSTIVTIVQQFSAGMTISASFTPVATACPIVGNSTICSDSLIVC